LWDLLWRESDRGRERDEEKEGFRNTKDSERKRRDRSIKRSGGENKSKGERAREKAHPISLMSENSCLHEQASAAMTGARRATMAMAK